MVVDMSWLTLGHLHWKEILKSKVCRLLNPERAFAFRKGKWKYEEIGMEFDKISFLLWPLGFMSLAWSHFWGHWPFGLLQSERWGWAGSQEPQPVLCPCEVILSQPTALPGQLCPHTPDSQSVKWQWGHHGSLLTYLWSFFKDSVLPCGVHCLSFLFSSTWFPFVSFRFRGSYVTP
jgi:hypothetical protein